MRIIPKIGPYYQKLYDFYFARPRLAHVAEKVPTEPLSTTSPTAKTSLSVEAFDYPRRQRTGEQKRLFGYFIHGVFGSVPIIIKPGL